MTGAGRNVALAILLFAALGALVLLVASLQAPIPGGGTAGTDGRGGGGGGDELHGRSGGGGGPSGDLCDEEEAAGVTASAAFWGLAPVPLGRRRRFALAAAGLALVAAGCFEPDCTSGGGGGGGGGSVRTGGGGGGDGTGSGGITGPGTGRGTEPDPPRIDPKAFWFILILVAVALLVALLVGLAKGRKASAARRALAGEEAKAGAEDAAALMASLPEGEARGVVACYVAACAALARRGQRRETWETAREFARRLPPESAEPMRRLTTLYEAARHGGFRPGDEALREAQELLRRVESAPAEVAPRG